MCGRYSNEGEFSEIRLAFKIERETLFRPYRPSYNISPSYGPGFEQLVVTRAGGGEREVKLARWWLIPPFWKKPLKELPTAFNARSEELATKPFWKGAFQTSRCLVPATGWREFKGSRGKKQPYHFRPEQRLFAFAGLWSTWVAPTGEAVESFAIVTTEPNSTAAAIHDRMPLVMPAARYDAWLDAHADGAEVLNQARAEGQLLGLEIYPTNPVGNRSAFEGPEAVERVDVEADELPLLKPIVRDQR